MNPPAVASLHDFPALVCRPRVSAGRPVWGHAGAPSWPTAILASELSFSVGSVNAVAPVAAGRPRGLTFPAGPDGNDGWARCDRRR